MQSLRDLKGFLLCSVSETAIIVLQNNKNYVLKFSVHSGKNNSFSTLKVSSCFSGVFPVITDVVYTVLDMEFDDRLRVDFYSYNGLVASVEALSTADDWLGHTKTYVAVSCSELNYHEKLTSG